MEYWKGRRPQGARGNREALISKDWSGSRATVNLCVFPQQQKLFHLLGIGVSYDLNSLTRFIYNSKSISVEELSGESSRLAAAYLNTSKDHGSPKKRRSISSYNLEFPSHT